MKSAYVVCCSFSVWRRLVFVLCAMRVLCVALGVIVLLLFLDAFVLLCCCWCVLCVDVLCVVLCCALCFVRLSLCVVCVVVCSQCLSFSVFLSLLALRFLLMVVYHVFVFCLCVLMCVL